MKRLFAGIAALMLFLCVFMIAACGEPFTVGYTTYDTTYEEILDMYIRVLNAGGNDGYRHDLFNDLIWNDFHLANEDPVSKRIQDTKNRVGYCIYDLNGDGIDELIIGENYAYVNEVFTTDHGKVRELIRAGMKYNCALLEDGCFYRHTSDGGAVESSAIWGMDGTSEVRFLEGYRRDDEFGSDWSKGISHENQWFVMKNENDHQPGDDKRVHIDEYLGRLKTWDQKLLPLSFIPLAVVEQGIDPDTAGIISVYGKTDGSDLVNIRSEAARESAAVKKVNTGTYVSILGEEENYYRISFSGLEGYVQKDYLTLLNSNASLQVQTIYPYEQEESIRSAYLESLNSGIANPDSSSESKVPMVLDTLAPTPAPALSMGSRGEEVKTLQSRLHDLGYYISEIHGLFDENTRDAVIDFQKTNGLNTDGIVGTQTKAILHSPQAKPKQSQDDLFDHNESIEVQRSRQVYDHDEYTMVDNGDGTYEEVSTPVYRTEYYTEGNDQNGNKYTYEQVFDHYETVEVQRSRQVYDHDEYTMVDNGDGTFEQVVHPVYRTEYYTEIVQQPVYRQVRKKIGE